MAEASSLLSLAERSSFIFAGSVTSFGPSPLQVLAPLDGLAVVRFDRGFLTNPVLGDLAGRPITVRTVQKAASDSSVVDQRVIFFATAWVHGKEIAVTEIGRLPDTKENEVEVARIVASLPKLHLSERLAAAAIVVHGTVRSIERATEIPGIPSEHDPYWMRAEIKVIEVLKGAGATAGARKAGTVVLFFPGSADRAFRKVPKPSLKQEAIFLLHAGAGSLAKLEAYFAPDPADVQPPSQLTAIRRMLVVR
jgi:hypothetical protein